MSALDQSDADTVTQPRGGEISDDMKRRMSQLRQCRNDYKNVMERTGFDRKGTTQIILDWIDETDPADTGEKGIAAREDFFSKDGSLVIREGEKLFYEFTAAMEQVKPYISEGSYRRWYDRFYDTSEQGSAASSFQRKFSWIRNDLKPFAERWKEVAEQRDALVGNPAFNDLVSFEPSLAILKNRDEFLDLHYSKRKSLVSQANALLLSSEKLQTDLYSNAKEKLQSAAGARYLADSNVGIWLERIFKSSSSPKKIEEFVNGSGTNSLHGLMQNWAKVKERYDGISKKFSERWQQTGVRGFELLSEPKFLSLHFTQRLRYVEQAEDRLDGANDIDNEAPVLIKLRHAMDIQDWDEAMLLVMEAKTAQLSEKEFRRLQSMKSYVNQFRGSEKQELLKGAMEGKKSLDTLVRRVPSALQPMIVRFLHSPYANRSIHQLRWILYNNIWCRTHGYLDQERAKKAASQENAERTRERAKSGLDIGRNDVLSHETGSYEFLRKEEHSKHSATVMSVNLESDQALATTEKMVEIEQSPNRLYWTTLNCFTQDGPTSESWNRDLLMILTEMRSVTRTMEKSGYTYAGLGAPLQSF